MWKIWISLGCLVIIAIGISCFLLQKHSSNDYLHEFDNAGESASKISTWKFFDHYNKSKTIDLYYYCTSTTCIYFPFDNTNNSTLSNSDASSFYNNYEISMMAIPNTAFQTPFQDSTTCQSVLPDFKQEAASGIADVASKSVEKTMPVGAAVIRTSAEALKYAQILKDTDPAILAVGTFCIGGYIQEIFIVADLNLCSSDIGKLENHVMHEGMSNEIMDCTSKVIQDLNNANYNPVLWFQYVETFANNIFHFNCFMTSDPNLCNNGRPQKSALELISNQLSTVKQIQLRLNNTSQKASTDIQLYHDRLYDKMSQTNSTIEESFNKIKEVNRVFFSHVLQDMIIFLVQKPTFNVFSCVDVDELSINKLISAYIDKNSYMYNSAIRDASNGMSLADEFDKQCNVNNKISL